MIINVCICYPPQRSTNVCFGCLQDALWARVSRIWACFVYVNIRHVLFVWALDMFCFYVSIGYVLFLFSWWSVSRTIFPRVHCSRYRQLDKNILHVSRQRLSGAGPQVSVAMPLLILCRPDPGTKKGAAHFRELVQTQAILDEPPSSINDLCACLHTQLFATWQFVGHQLHKIRWFPHEFASHFHALLLVNNTVVQDTAHFGFIRTCTVSMENHWRSLSNRSASGFQSTLRIAPGPGARVVVRGGFNRTKTNDSGRPRATSPAHCSQCTRESFMSLSNVASSASTSCQQPFLPRWISFSFFSTKFLRRKTKLRQYTLQGFVVDRSQDVDCTQRHIGEQHQQSHGLHL